MGRLGGIRRCLGRRARSLARLELARRFAQLAGDFAKKTRRPAFRLWRDFLFHVAPQPAQFFVNSPANLFELVHFGSRFA